MAKRRRRRRGSYGFLFALFAVIAGVLLFVVMSGMFFKVTTIRVEGVSVYREADIVEETGFTTGENIFLLNKVAAIRSIRAAFPYADSVKIKRELPGTVVIIISEKAPVVMVETGEYYWYMDEKGILLEMRSAPLTSGDLPIAKGLTPIGPIAGTQADFGDEQDKLLVLLTLLGAMLEKGIWHEVDNIDLTRISNPSFRYLDSITVKLGAPEHLSYKLDFMLEYVKVYGIVEKGTLDLSSVYDRGDARFRPE